MKKYILGSLVLMSMVGFLGVNIQHVDAKVKIGAKCGGSTRSSQDGMLVPNRWTLYSNGSGGYYVACGILPVHRPWPIAENIQSPVSNTVIPNTANPGVSATNPIQYIFRTYPLLPGDPLPANDPATIGNNPPPIDPYSNGTETPVDVNADGTVGSIFSTIASTAKVIWEPTSLFDNMEFWNQPMMSSFRAFRQSTGGNTPAEKWYPAQINTLPNPASQIPLTRVKLSWKPVAGADSYHVKITVVNNPLNVDPNTPAEVVVPATTRNYEFDGRGKVWYKSEAVPFVAGQEIIGPDIIEQPIVSMVQGNINTSHPNDYYTYKWPTILGAVSYKLQYAVSFAPIIEGTPFADGATFVENSKTVIGTPGGLYTVTTHVLPGVINENSNDSDTGYHSFDFANSPLASIHPTIPFQDIYWRVEGIDNQGNVIKENIKSTNYFTPPVAKKPYAQAFPTWNSTAGATSYVVDMAETPDALNLLPKLTNQTSVAEKTGTTTSSGTFLLRRIAPAHSYTTGTLNAGLYANDSAKKFVVDEIIKSLKEDRISFVNINAAMGIYDFENSVDEADALDRGVPYVPVDYQGNDMDIVTNFDNNSPSNYSDYLSAENWIYPLVTDELGLVVVPQTASNVLKFTTNAPISIKKILTGNATISVSQIVTNSSPTNYKMTTTLTFGGTNGSYAFNITKHGNNGLNLADENVNQYDLTYPTIGPVSVVPSLGGKDITEFARLLPGKQYFYRVTPLTDSSAETNVPFTFGLTSPVMSLTTPTMTPDSMTISTDGETTLSAYDLQGTIKSLDINTNQKLLLRRPPGREAINTPITWTVVPSAIDYVVTLKDANHQVIQTVATTGSTYTITDPNVAYYSLQARNSVGAGTASIDYLLPVSVVSKTATIGTVSVKTYLANLKAYMTSLKATRKAYEASFKATSAANKTRLTAIKTANATVSKSIKNVNALSGSVKVTPTPTNPSSPFKSALNVPINNLKVQIVVETAPGVYTSVSVPSATVISTTPAGIIKCPAVAGVAYPATVDCSETGLALNSSVKLSATSTIPTILNTHFYQWTMIPGSTSAGVNTCTYPSSSNNILCTMTGTREIQAVYQCNDGYGFNTKSNQCEKSAVVQTACTKFSPTMTNCGLGLNISRINKNSFTYNVAVSPASPLVSVNTAPSSSSQCVNSGTSTATNCYLFYNSSPQSVTLTASSSSGSLPVGFKWIAGTGLPCNNSTSATCTVNITNLTSQVAGGITASFP